MRPINDLSELFSGWSYLLSFLGTPDSSSGCRVEGAELQVWPLSLHAHPDAAQWACGTRDEDIMLARKNQVLQIFFWITEFTNLNAACRFLRMKVWLLCVVCLPVGLIPMCVCASMTKPPIGWPSGPYGAAWLPVDRQTLFNYQHWGGRRCLHVVLLSVFLVFSVNAMGLFLI